MSVEELNRDQLIELKQRYLDEIYYGISYDQLASIDSIVPDEVVFNYYEGITFSEDDFFCSCS